MLLLCFFLNARRVALRMISGKNIFNFGIQKSLRAFLNPFFTGRGNSLSQSLTALPAPSEREPLAKPETSHLNRKLYRYAKGSPFGRAGALAPERARTLPLRSRTLFPRTAKSSPLRESRKSRQVLTERGVQEKFSAVVTSVISVQ